MKKLIFILFFLLSYITVWGQNDPYDTDPTKYEPAVENTQYVVLGIFRIGSDPGGWENRNTFWVDSLFNSLIVYTDTSQLFIRNDTLLFAGGFITSIIDTAQYDTINTKILNFDPAISVPGHMEGRIAYDSASHSIIYFTEEPDITMNIGRETWIRIYNNSGVTIPNGSYVYPTGAIAGGWGTVALALANADSTSNVIGQATHSIENDTFGYLTRFGRVSDMNTIGLQLGGTGYLSADTVGRPTTIAPQAPNNIVALGGVTSVGASGSMFALMDRFNPINGEAAIGFADSSAEITVSIIDTNYQITNGSGTLFAYNTDVGHDISLSGDTLYLAEIGVYEFILDYAFEGTTGGIYRFRMKQNDSWCLIAPGNHASGRRKTGSADVGSAGFSAKIRTTVVNTPITFWFQNKGNTDNITMVDATIIVRQVR